MIDIHHGNGMATNLRVIAVSLFVVLDRSRSTMAFLPRRRSFFFLLLLAIEEVKR